MLNDRQIRSVGKAILLYQPLPAMREFHKNPAKNRWLCGGNRSGKSEGNIGFDLCSYALGVHPHRKTPKKTTIWAAANSWSLVGKLLWMEKIKSYLPALQIQSINWHNKNAEIPAELRLVNGNRIEFKAYEQGRKAFEGRAIDAFYGDEQCKSVGWYESGKSKTKALPSKALAEHYRQIKYTQLNSDVFTGTISIDWKKMRDEYLHSKKVAGYVEASLYEVALTLRHFERLVGKCNSKQIKQNAIDKFILERGEEVIRSTVNKDIRNLRAFINWCRENRYVNGEIKIQELKEDERPVKSLSNTQIKKLLSTSKRHKTLRMRILLALGTSLRLGDIDSIRISDIDFENGSITTRCKKTRKSMGSRPVPVPIMAELKKYVSGLDAEQENIFHDNFSRYTWKKIRKKLGLDDFKFHDLRKTFCSLLAQNGVSTAVTQKLLEHSSSDLTNKVYTNVDPVLRHAVDQIPIGDWL